MPSIPLHPPPPHPTSSTTFPSHPNPLPPFLRISSGLALLELQGQLQIEELQDLPAPPSSIPQGYHTQRIPIGLIAFPPEAFSTTPKLTSEGGKRGKNGVVKEVGGVLLFVGKWQKMRGEVRELAKPLGVVVRRGGWRGSNSGGAGNEGGGREGEEEVEIVDVVRWKVVFSTRPEPVG